jgi:hypothetical protein
MNIFKKCLISGFIFFNLLAMIRVHMPLQSKFISFIYRPIDSYLSFFSIYQDWKMFAPNPSKRDTYLTAEVIFDDGTLVTYNFVDATQMTLYKKYTYGEKFRKLINEGIRLDNNSRMWPDTARFALRKLKHQHYDKIPVSVALMKHWDEIPHINKEFRARDYVAQDLKSATFYTYKVLK